jgi:hypothetical protein
MNRPSITISVVAGTIRSTCRHRRIGIGAPCGSGDLDLVGVIGGAAAVRNMVGGGPIGIAARDTAAAFGLLMIHRR